MARMTTVAIRLPSDIVERLPEAGIKGERTAWIRDAIEQKMEKENDSVLRSGAQPEQKPT